VDLRRVGGISDCTQLTLATCEAVVASGESNLRPSPGASSGGTGKSDSLASERPLWAPCAVWTLGARGKRPGSARET
jgi:hypothetical protein